MLPITNMPPITNLPPITNTPRMTNMPPITNMPRADTCWNIGLKLHVLQVEFISSLPSNSLAWKLAAPQFQWSQTCSGRGSLSFLDGSIRWDGVWPNGNSNKTATKAGNYSKMLGGTHAELVDAVAEGAGASFAAALAAAFGTASFC